MKVFIRLTFLVFLLNSGAISAQFGNGNRFGNRGGNRAGRTAIPQAQTPPKEPEALTAGQLVDKEMPRISEALELNAFEDAIVRSILVKYVQKKIELQILKLEPAKIREEYGKLSKLQDSELKAGLPEDKYNAYIELQENQFKTKKKKKKKKKKRKS